MNDAEKDRADGAVAAARPRLVADRMGLDALLEELRREPEIALDTESNSFHVYRERLCLLQLSTRAGDWVVDPLAIDPRPLGAVLADGREVVLHGADYDVRCLKREYGWSLPGLFDTMAAARRLGLPGLGLSALVQAHFGVKLSKAPQRSDWGRRPLTPEQLRYASLDTHFLLDLRALLLDQLRQRGLEKEARREFGRIAAVEPRPKVFDPDGYRRLRSARALDTESSAILKALYAARESRASEIDRPPFKVLSEQAMVEIARRRPRTSQEIALIPGITPQVMRRMGDLILSALEGAYRAQGAAGGEKGLRGGRAGFRS